MSTEAGHKKSDERTEYYFEIWTNIWLIHEILKNQYVKMDVQSIW